MTQLTFLCNHWSRSRRIRVQSFSSPTTLLRPSTPQGESDLLDCARDFLARRDPRRNHHPSPGPPLPSSCLPSPRALREHTSCTGSGARSTPAPGRSAHSSTRTISAPGACSSCSCALDACSGAGRRRHPRAAGGGRVSRTRSNGRSMVLVLALVLLAISVALGASRSDDACAGVRCGLCCFHGAARTRLQAKIPVDARPGRDGGARGSHLRGRRLLSRLDETRQLGLAQRVAIWRDTLTVVRDFPVTGAGAGNFATAHARLPVVRSDLLLERGP
jgi:hypothetical protein